MLKGRDPKRKYLYTPIREEKAENPTKVWLKRISRRLHAKIDDESIEMITESVEGEDDRNIHRVKGGTKKLSTLRGGVCGWENMGDAEGELVEWKDSTPAEIEESIGWFDEDLLNELFFELTDNTEALAEIRKEYEKEQKDEE